jgi:hypothetical protein
VATSRALLALLLLLGLAACEDEPAIEAVDAAQLDLVLAEYSDARARVLESVAVARETELAASAALDRAAARQALDLADHRTTTHIGLDGTSPFDRLRAHGGELRDVREFIFRIEGDPEDLAAKAAASWLAPFDDNAVLTEPATHAAVAFAPVDEGGYVGVLLLAHR